MKFNILIFLVLVAQVCAQGQNIIASKAVEGSELIFNSNKKQVLKIDSTQFFLFKEKKDGNYAVKFNDNLEELLSFKIQELTSYYPNCQYLPSKKYLVNLKKEKTKNKSIYFIDGLIYDAIDGSKITEKTFIKESKLDYTDEFSENKEYFILCHEPEYTSREPLLVRAYKTADLSELYELEIQLDKNNKFIGYHITNNGFFVVLINDGKDRQLITRVFSIKGEQLFEKKNEYGKTSYCYQFVHEEKENIILLSLVSGVGDVISGLEEWEIDINSKRVARNYQLLLNKKILDSKIFNNAYNGAGKKNLYDKAYKSTPSKLKSYIPTNVILLGNKSKVFVIENLSASYNTDFRTTSKFAKEIIFLNIDPKGKINWGTLINRNLYSGSNAGHDNPFISGAKGLQTICNVGKNSFYTLNWEQKNYKYIIVLRKFDLKTGKLTLANVFDKEKIKYLNNSFIEWLTSDEIALLNMQGIQFSLAEKKFELQIIELDK